MTVVNEPGLYTLILSSRKSEAKAFKRWITHEVIPTIRKTGGYMTDSLLERIQKEPAVIMEFAQALIREKNRVKALEVELNTVKPKADYRELMPTLEYVRQEQKQEKPSIRDQLKAAAKQQPEKKSPVKSKTHDMEL